MKGVMCRGSRGIRGVNSPAMRFSRRAGRGQSQPLEAKGRGIHRTRVIVSYLRSQLQVLHSAYGLAHSREGCGFGVPCTTRDTVETTIEGLCLW